MSHTRTTAAGYKESQSVYYARLSADCASVTITPNAVDRSLRNRHC